MPTWGYERAVNDVKRARTPTHRSWLGLCRRICCDGFMTVQVQKRSDPQGVRRLLEALPSWFGIPDAIDGYVAAGDTMPSYLAVQDDRTLGVALVKRHYAESAELYLMAVDPLLRRSGIGRQLVHAVVDDLRGDGVRFLQVKTVGESFPDEGYAETRAFYLALGFTPLEEFALVSWDGPTLQLVMALAPLGPGQVP